MPRHHSVLLLTLAIVACADRPRAAKADGGVPDATAGAAADVPDVDVRRLPPDRKAALPDVMLRAADRGRVLGADSAKVDLFIVSDLQCAECKRWYVDTWPMIRDEFVNRGLVRVTFVHYPLRANANAVIAASAVMCASAQGQFWPAVDRVFASQAQWSASATATELLDSLASVPGVDRRVLSECTSSRRMWRQVRADINWLDAKGASALPLMLVGSHRLGGTSLPTQVRATIDSVLAGK